MMEILGYRAGPNWYGSPEQQANYAADVIIVT
jgi:hypothetical protein